MTMDRQEQARRHAEIERHFTQAIAEREARHARLQHWWNSGPYMISSVQDALDALHVPSLDDLTASLSDLLSPFEVTHQDGWLHESGAQVTMLGLGHTGVALFEPGGPEDFRLTVGTLAEAADQEDQIELESLVASLIESVEGFRVYVHCRSWSAEAPPEPFLYPYVKPAPSQWTVDEWMRKRVSTQVPSLGQDLPTWEVIPYLRSGQLAPEHYRLDELRPPGTTRS